MVFTFTSWNSNKKYNLQYVVSNLQYVVSNLQYVVSNLQYVVSNSQYAVSNLQYAVSNLQYVVSNLQYVVSNLRHAISFLGCLKFLAVCLYLLMFIEGKLWLLVIVIDCCYVSELMYSSYSFKPKQKLLPAFYLIYCQGYNISFNI